MRPGIKRIRTRFGPDARFELRPTPGPTFRALQDDRLEEIKGRLLNERLGREPDVARTIYIRRAANEAAAIAWTTPFPLLVFPALFDEKVATAFVQATLQNEVLERSRELFLAV